MKVMKVTPSTIKSNPMKRLTRNCSMVQPFPLSLNKHTHTRRDWACPRPPRYPYGQGLSGSCLAPILSLCVRQHLRSLLDEIDVSPIACRDISQWVQLPALQFGIDRIRKG